MPILGGNQQRDHDSSKKDSQGTVHRHYTAHNDIADQLSKERAIANLCELDDDYFKPITSRSFLERFKDNVISIYSSLFH